MNLPLTARRGGLLGTPISLAAALVLLCGAGPKNSASHHVTLMQMADLGPLGQVAAPAKTVIAQPVGFEPAPVPDPDVDAPVSAAGPRPNVSPRLFSAKNEFQGDGYSFGSSQQASLEELKKPAAGLGISVPVKYGPSD